ncbi:MAG: PAS domain-containing protein [Magnetococcales bacterium]|nr:PAS domain-containing protein [Magnetococcales bacterium]MBF0115345.1 PAS domain-containing protein [Magnetococcales bacterium]
MRAYAKNQGTFWRSFSMVACASFVLGVLLIVLLIRVTDSVSKLYEHPFKVSNSARQSQILIGKRQRLMYEFLQQPEQVPIEHIQKVLDEYENDLAKRIGLIEGRFLGSRELLHNLVDACVQLRLVHQNILDKVQLGEYSAALRDEMVIARRQAESLDVLIEEVIAYAEGRAYEFRESALQTQRVAIVGGAISIIVIMLLAGGVLLRQQRKFHALDAERRAAIAAQSEVLQSLLQANQLLEELFRTSHLSIAFLDKNFNFMRVNRSYADKCGVDPGYFNGKNHFALYPYPENEEIFQRVVDSGQPFTVYGKPFEFPDHPEWGTTYWDWSLVPILNQEGKTDWLLFVLLDVTAIKRNELALQESNRMLRTVLDAIPTRVFWKNTQSVFLGCNRSFAQHAGLHSVEEVVGKDDFTLSPFLSKGAESYRKMDQQVMNSGESMYFPDVTFIKEGGNRGWANTYKVPLRDGAGRIIGVLGVFEDVTELKLLEEKMDQLQEKILQNDRLATLGLIAAGIAHEVNNPSNIIAINSRLVLDIWDDAQVILNGYHQQYGEFSLGGITYSELGTAVESLLTGIGENAHRIKTTVINMQALVRQRQLPGRSPVDLRVLLGSILEFLHARILRCTNTLTTQWQEIPYWVFGNSEQLFQVFSNLITNALQALPSVERGITLTLAQDPGAGMVVVEVRDEGRGIAEEQLVRIGEVFFTTRSEEGGMGLGISIVRRILEQHGGSMAVESTVGVGTVVTIRLPEWKPDGDK